MDSFDITKINFENLRRKFAFQSGVNFVSAPEHDQKNQLKPFDRIPDVLPIKFRAEQSISEEIKEASKLLPSDGDLEQGKRNFQFAEGNREQVLKQFELISCRKLSYDKPILIIYNPNSGKKTNLVPLIEQRLNKENIKFEMMATKKALDTFYYACEVDLDKYSLLVAAGGDGTYHEVANGMLARRDKKKIPFGMIPNGSGNDTCSSMGIFTLDHALDYIVNGMVTSIDTIQVLIDHDKDDQNWSLQERLRYGRHMLINCCVSMPALVNNEAAKFKECCGKASYSIATLEQAILGKIRQELFTITVDGVEQKHQTLHSQSTILVFMANGRYTGGGIIVDPYACMNDGLVDICWIHDENIMGLFGVAGMLDKAKTKGAIHAYDNQTTFTRGKRLRIDFNGLRGRPVPTAGWGPQLICIDGEGLQFNKFVNFETMPGNIEMLFDPKSYFYEHKSF